MGSNPRAPYDLDYAKCDMPDATLAFKTYRRTQLYWDGFGAVHGEYDGLTTGTYRHAHAQILVPLKGRLQLEVGAERHWLGPERAIALLPNTAHAATTLGGACEFLAINGPASWLATLAGACDLALPATGAINLGEAGVWLQARQLAMALDTPRAGHTRFLAAGVEQLGLYAVAAAALPVQASAPPNDVERAVALIFARHAEDLTIAGLASALAVSPRHLERGFARILGTTPRRFLIDVRLAAARDLLTTTALPIEAIGARVGFGDVSHFTRSFRAAMGVSPGAFRRARQLPQ